VCVQGKRVQYNNDKGHDKVPENTHPPFYGCQNVRLATRLKLIKQYAMKKYGGVEV
jgi:hypothetical protein